MEVVVNSPSFGASPLMLSVFQTLFNHKVISVLDAPFGKILELAVMQEAKLGAQIDLWLKVRKLISHWMCGCF